VSHRLSSGRITLVVDGGRLPRMLVVDILHVNCSVLASTAARGDPLMGTGRSEIIIERPADDVWAIVGEAPV
jgi:hypothetical protein